MSNKEYLLQLLAKLEPYWEPAKGFLLIVQNVWSDHKIIDALIWIIKKAIKETDNAQMKQHLESSLTLLEKIQQAELEQREVDEAECEVLLEELAMI